MVAPVVFVFAYTFWLRTAEGLDVPRVPVWQLGQLLHRSILLAGAVQHVQDGA